MLAIESATAAAMFGLDDVELLVGVAFDEEDDAVADPLPAVVVVRGDPGTQEDLLAAPVSLTSLAWDS